MTVHETAFRAIAALDALRVDYFLAGSLASMYYSFTRNTADADFVVHLQGVSIADIVRELGEGFHRESQMKFETITATVRHVVHYRNLEFKLEFFELSRDEFDQSRFARRIQVELEGAKVFLPTAEDVLVQKLRWGRKKDLEDAKNVLNVQGLAALDWDYLSHWCDLHGTRAELERMRNDVFPLP